jgi:hypothetical protein
MRIADSTDSVDRRVHWSIGESIGASGSMRRRRKVKETSMSSALGNDRFLMLFSPFIDIREFMLFATE